MKWCYTTSLASQRWLVSNQQWVISTKEAESVANKWTTVRKWTRHSNHNVGVYEMNRNDRTAHNYSELHRSRRWIHNWRFRRTPNVWRCKNCCSCRRTGHSLVRFSLRSRRRGSPGHHSPYRQWWTLHRPPWKKFHQINMIETLHSIPTISSRSFNKIQSLPAVKENKHQTRLEHFKPKLLWWFYGAASHYLKTPKSSYSLHHLTLVTVSLSI